MAAVLEAMSVPDAIERTIREISAKYSLNACEIRCGVNDDSSKRIQWNSQCGVLGDVRFRVSLSKFETNLEEGVRSVSTLISFATLLNAPENHSFAEKVRDAGRNGSPNLYHIDIFSQNQMNVYIGFMTSGAFGPLIGAYRLIPIHFDVNEETGQYRWSLPDNVLENYADVIARESDDSASDPDEMLGGAGGLYGDSSSEDGDDVENERISRPRARPRAVREATTYASIGLMNVDSPSIPILEATTSIRQYSGQHVEIHTPINDYPMDTETRTGNPAVVNRGDDIEENEFPRGPSLVRKNTCHELGE